MILPFIRVIFVMLLLSVMVGLLRMFPRIVKFSTIEHALGCPNGAFPTVRHNGIKDLTAELMSELCHDVSKESSLQPLSGESLSLRACNRDDGAQLDIKASGFWGGRFQSSFSMSTYLTLMLLRTDQTPTASIKVQSAKHTKREFVRSTMRVLAFCFFHLWRHGYLHYSYLYTFGFPLVLPVEDSML